jgi:NAD(P)-dependent dehydrogenase (short-subunit alcohol dehydrogenase family)
MSTELTRMFDLSGRVAVVTGGARHLGHDAASVLAAAGCDLVITSRNLDHAEETAESIRRTHAVSVLPLELDQTKFDDVASAAARSQAWRNRIDILVNNAGGGSGHTVATLFERDPVDIARTIQLNLTGVIYCCREFGRVMARQGRGKIVNIASIAGMLGRDRRMYERAGMNGQPVDYAAAKAGVLGLTMDLAGFLGPSGVHVNAISPGGFERPGIPQQFLLDYSDRTPLGRMGHDGLDLKGAVLFLASPASDYVTGHNLVVDGGFSIWH